MHDLPVAFQVVSSWDSADIIALYQSAGWWRDWYDPAGIVPLIQGSFVFVVAVQQETGKAVAMGRILSDRVATGYIQDLCVLTELRGRHIGVGLLNFLIAEAKRRGISSLYLVAEPDTRDFYEKSGFICNSGMIFLTNTLEESYET
ncbi:MAG: GNAT family N-acetyltransferase [Methanospirillum sp.]|uniref:GNAT family N-acetyltransferase n=1 Tax=Methanospirillum sp. TaxID=45200 RepID=UPI0023701C13|nr:GNAT family N-acetyltransferase [Methanospirillum sp.]MDD1728938.1 GNAT family N-acetyltransferase [Methanospirillum sp.]